MPNIPYRIPSPEAEALSHSRKLVARIRAEIESRGGWISFARYMELALYAPGLGYYACGATKFGASGDFVTAPEMTPLFGRALAGAAAGVVREASGDILELGAGSGRLALDILGELERLDCLPGHYRILEVSPDLRERQRHLLATHAPHLLPRVEWLDVLPECFDGLILGNEVLDALPVYLLSWRDGRLHERGVALAPLGSDSGNHFVWEERVPDSVSIAEFVPDLPDAGDYLTEICPAASALVSSLAKRLRHGVMLFMDYGFPRAEYYHPQRHMGTMKVHYRHHSLDDPFFLPGLADITAHVDFSAVARAGTDAGLDLLGYTSQANFLLDAGMLDLMLEMEPMTPLYMREASAAQKLLQPSEMGELFKVIALGRGIPGELIGFRRGDRRGAL